MKNLTHVAVFSLAVLSSLAAAAMAPRAAMGAKSPGRSEFLSYLEANLPALYATEIKRLCIEENEVEFCREYADRLNADRKFDEAISFAEDLGRRPATAESATLLMKADGLFGAGRYAEAIAQLDALVAGLPPEEDLAEAVFLRAKCQTEMGKTEEALLSLRAIEPRIKAGDRSDFAAWLARCEEASGEFQDAIRLYGEAWKSGSPDAGLGLVRCNLRQGKVDAALGLEKEAVKRGIAFPSDGAADLAVAFEDVAPAVWGAMIRSVAADTAFDLGARPDLVASIVRAAEAGENLFPYWSALTKMPGSSDTGQWIRYAQALGESGGPRAAESLSVLMTEAADPGLKLRCFGAAAAAAPGRREDLVRRIGPGLHSLAGLLPPDDRLALCGLLTESGAKDAALVELRAMVAELQAGRDDQSLAQIAALIESAGDREGALAVSDAVAQSPVLSRTTLACEKQTYLGRLRLKREADAARMDIAGEVEKIARKGASDLELGDLFMDNLGDYGRASTYYARALAAAPSEKGADAIRLKLARALSLAAYAVSEPEGGAGQAGAAQKQVPKAEAAGPETRPIDLVRAVAASDGTKPEDVIAAAKLATDWLRTDQASVADLAGTLSRRKDVTGASLYATASLLFALVIEGNPSYSERCSALLNRVWTDYSGSKQAPLAAFTLARLRFALGNYADARIAFEACAGKSRDGLLVSLCNLGIGECFLRSGGFAEAVDYFRKADSPAAYLEIARSYEILGAPDSSLAYYRESLGAATLSSYGDQARLGIALVMAAGPDVPDALASLDSPLPATRQRLNHLMLVASAYRVGLEGYRKIAIDALLQAQAAKSSGASRISLVAPLLAARLASEDDPEDALALVSRVMPQDDFFDNFLLALDRARYSCSSPEAAACAEARQTLKRRFPLDTADVAELDVRRGLAILRSEAPDKAGAAFVDSVIASVDGSPLLPEVLYRRGVRSLVEGDYGAAKRSFGRIAAGSPESDLYGDATFKLGSTYYLTEKYDSSAAFFGVASLNAKPSLARDALFNRGLALEEVGAFGEAADAYETLALRFPWSDQFDRALIRRGYCLQSAGRPEEAAEVYRAVLRYVDSEEARAEAGYWIGESFAQSGDHARAACEFLRTAFFYPKQEAWAGTSAYQAGAECEKAGLVDYAITIYRWDVKRFGKSSDWGQASQQRLDELDTGAGKGAAERPAEGDGSTGPEGAPEGGQAPSGDKPR